MGVGDAHAFPGFLTPEAKTNFFPKPLTTCTFLTCFSRGKRLKYAGKFLLNQVSNSQPPCQESEMLTTEPSGRGPTTHYTNDVCHL